MFKDDKDAQITLLSTLKEAAKKRIVNDLEGEEIRERLNDMVNTTNYFHIYHIEYDI